MSGPLQGNEIETIKGTESLTLRDSEASSLPGFLSPEKASEVEAEGAGWAARGCPRASGWAGRGDASPYWPLRPGLDSGSCQRVLGWQVHLVPEDGETRASQVASLTLAPPGTLFLLLFSRVCERQTRASVAWERKETARFGKGPFMRPASVAFPPRDLVFQKRWPFPRSGKNCQEKPRTASFQGRPFLPFMW